MLRISDIFLSNFIVTFLYTSKYCLLDLINTNKDKRPSLYYA